MEEKTIEEQISMYEGVIHESNVLLKYYDAMLTHLKPNKDEINKISKRILDVVSIKEYSQKQLEKLKNK